MKFKIKVFSKKFKIIWGIILSLMIAICITLGVICIVSQQWISFMTAFINVVTATYLLIFMLCH